MKTRYVVEVTDMDCATGVRNNKHYCVAQTALERLIPEATRFDVDKDTTRFTLEDESGKRFRFVYATPRELAAYIIAFDHGTDPWPMTFTLEKPQVTETPRPNPNAVRHVRFKAASKPTGSRTRRVFGENSFKRPEVA